MNRKEVLQVVATARESGKRPNLNGADLSGTDLSGTDLSGTDLSGTDLSGTDLHNADLSWAKLWGANLWGANLRGANLYGANLWGANLRGANLYGADLRLNLLRQANLQNTDLRNADLRGTVWHGLLINKLPSGHLILTPTPDGWQLQVGCWNGTPDELRELISKDKGWPEAEGEEITRRRPYLQAALTLCEAHIKDHTHVIDKLKARWGNE